MIYRQLCNVIGAWLAENVRELVLVAGVILLAHGAQLVYRPAGWIVPGLLLVWLGLPSRPALTIRPTDTTKER